MKATGNFNDYVWVQLTPQGEATLRADIRKYSELDDDQPTRYDVGDGWSRFHLYDLMNIFGSKMFNGSPEPQFIKNVISYTDPLHV